jgi:hypothetical protein
MTPVRVLDWTALAALHEAVLETKTRGVSVVFINIHDSTGVLGLFKKFGIRNYIIQNKGNDDGDDEAEKELQRYLNMSALDTIRLVCDLEEPPHNASVEEKGKQGGGGYDIVGISGKEEFGTTEKYS